MLGDLDVVDRTRHEKNGLCVPVVLDPLKENSQMGNRGYVGNDGIIVIRAVLNCVVFIVAPYDLIDLCEAVSETFVV